jgi:drug/metabolite transporter (DMT)-like permease
LILAKVRFLIAATIYSPVILLKYMKENEPKMADLKKLAVFGFISISIYFWLQYTVVQNVEAGISAVLVTGLIPVLTGLAGTAFLKERFNLKKGVGIAFDLCGVTLISPSKLLVNNID